MKTTADDGRAQQLELVLGLVRTRTTAVQREVLERFVVRYFGQVDPEDLAERAPADLYGAALSHWNFARRREPGHARVRVFNPSIEEHGWQSTHTIIEIVNDDMPFLVDSVTMEVNRHGLTLHLIVHPIVAVMRGDDGTLADVAPDDARDARRESFIHVEVDRVIEPARLDALAADVARVLADVRMAVADWAKMRDRLVGVVAEIDARPPPMPPEELAEAKAFLSWLADAHFTLLAYRCHDLVVVDGQDALKIVPGSSLGFLREDPTMQVATSFAALPPEVRAYARVPDLLIVTKANARSTVHRPGYLDYVGIKRFDAAGNVCGEHRFLGLYTSAAYSASPADIPLLRRKTANVVARAGVALRQPRRQGAAQHPREPSARRAVPDERGRPAAHGDGHPPSRRAAAVPAVRPARSVRALSRLPHLRAARELHDRAAREMGGDPARRVQRDERGVQRPSVGVGAGARDDHRAHDPRQDPRVRRPRPRGPARARGAALGRRSQGRADRRARARRAATSSSAASPARCPPPTARTSPPGRRCPTSR